MESVSGKSPPWHPTPYPSIRVWQVETQRLKKGQLNHPFETHDSGNVVSRVSMARKPNNLNDTLCVSTLTRCFYFSALKEMEIGDKASTPTRMSGSAVLRELDQNTKKHRSSCTVRGCGKKTPMRKRRETFLVTIRAKVYNDNSGSLQISNLQ